MSNEIERQQLLMIGIMTGNSLDAADAVLTVFDENGGMMDLAFHSKPFPADLQNNLRKIRTAIMEADGDMEAVSRKNLTLQPIIKRYTQFVAGTEIINRCDARQVCQ